MLDKIFQEPVPSNILWSDGESPGGTLGREVSEGNGSRVRVCLNGMGAVFHRPQSPSHKATAGQAHRRKLIEARLGQCAAS